MTTALIVIAVLIAAGVVSLVVVMSMWLDR
jgi:hypothetical protein